LAVVVGLLEPVKIFLTSRFINMQNLVTVSHAVCEHVGHKNLGALGHRPLGMGAWLTPANTFLPTCVTMPNLVFLHQTIRA